MLFNPAEYSIERANAFKATSIPGLSGPLMHFINGDADVLSMELFFDDYTDQAAQGEPSSSSDRRHRALLEIDRELHAPPPVQFVWGKLTFSRRSSRSCRAKSRCSARRHPRPARR